MEYKYIVVEDEDLIRTNIIKKTEALKLPLKFAGEADNGEDGLALADKTIPDIIFTDIKMPIMDGLAMAEEIHFSYPDTKIIIITGFDDFTFAQKAIRLGVTDYILKPVSSDELLSLLKRVISEFESPANRLTEPRKKTADLGRSPEETVRLLEIFIERQFQEDITLADVAHDVGYTTDYLCKLFKKINGESPAKYLQRLRIERSKRLLVDMPELEIGAVGECVGYKDRYYFSRVFKNQIGVYPSEYRKGKGKFL